MNKMQFDALFFLAMLKVWRKMHALSIREISELTGIAPSTMGFISTGDRTPTIAEFTNLCNLMDVDPKDFFIKEKERA